MRRLPDAGARHRAIPRASKARPATSPGLGLLDIETTLGGAKILRPAAGIELASGAPVAGYEMHVGRSAGGGAARPMLRLGTEADGAVSRDGRIAGCHLHGLFASDPFRRAFLARLGGAGEATLAWEARVEAALDGLARHLEASLDLARLVEIARAR